MNYVYFVSFAHQQGFGYGEITANDEITTMAGVRSMADRLAESGGYGSIVVLSFQLLRVEEAPTTDGAEPPANRGA